MAPALAGAALSTTSAPPDRNMSPGLAHEGERTTLASARLDCRVVRHISSHVVRNMRSSCRAHRPVISTACNVGQPLPWLLRPPPGSSASADTPCTVLMCFFMLSLREKGRLHTKHTWTSSGCLCRFSWRKRLDASENIWPQYLHIRGVGEGNGTAAAAAAAAERGLPNRVAAGQRRGAHIDCNRRGEKAA